MCSSDLAAIDIWISTGKPTAVVPDVVDVEADEAERRLKEAGFNVRRVSEPASDTCPQTPGTVCRQDPPGGSTREKGTTVTIVVAEPEPSPTDPISPSP